MRNMIFCLTLTLVLLSGVCTPTLIKAEVLTEQTFPLKAGDDLGREIELLERPRRIVSLAPTHTEILFALGVGGNIVGVTEYCNYPAEAKKKQKVGGFTDPDIEKILRLKPDLILAFGTVQKPVVQELEKRGQKLFWVYPRSVNEILALFERIGKITGRPQAAQRLRKEVGERIRDVEERIEDIPKQRRPTIFRVMGLDPPGTVGGDSFQSDIYRIAGGKNIFNDIDKDYFQIDPKMVIERDPDVIIVCGKNPERLKKKVKNQKGWEDLTAVKKNEIFVISCDLICSPSPRIAETIEKIAGYLYPERFLSYPQRIISLGPSLTEELFLLGVQDKIVGVTTYCQRPPEVKAKKKVGTVVEVNVERIMSLKPDLVLATSLTNPKQAKKLKSLGIRVVNFPEAGNFSQICERFLELAKMVGREKEARDIIEKAKSRVGSVRQKAKGLPKPKVFIQVGARPLVTVTVDSFIHSLIEFAGGINIVSGAKSGLYSREEVLKQNPEVIIIVTMGIVGEEEKGVWERYKTLQAAKKKRVCIIGSDKVCSPTPISFVDVLEEMFELLHPQKNKEEEETQGE